MCKMTKLSGNPAKWRESASLLILAKDNKLNQRKTFDYNVLLFKRTSKSSFMPNSFVFPGGVREQTDESPLWLQHFRSFGVQDEKLKQLTCVAGPRPSIYTKACEGHLERELSLRITAIRETFEEVGVLCCCDHNSIEDFNGYGRTFDGLDKEYWQKLIHNDSSQFLNLCQEHNVIPDLWGLHEWSAWLTPSNGKNRFQTAFYLVALENTPNVIMEKHEVTDYAWKSPYAYVSAHLSKELWLPPPQFYELSRLLKIIDIKSVRDFAMNRASKGTTLMLPVQYNCTDGRVSLLPGDDMYLEDPNEPTEVITINTTMEEFRAGAKKLHRYEFKHMNENALLLNFDLPNDHLSPIDFNLVKVAE